MKATAFIILVFVGLVHPGFSFWKPGRNYIYDVHAKLRSPECATESGGLVVNYKVIVTPVGANTLHLNPHDFNAVGVEDAYAANSSIINQIRIYVESPMELTFHNGMVQSVKVESKLPEWAMDIKKEQASYFSANSNGFSRFPQSMGNGNNNAYRLVEESVHGTCETKYKVNRMHYYNHNSEANYQARENNQHPVESNWEAYCNQDDKLYEIVKSTKLYKCNGENQNLKTNPNKPKVVTRYIACGRRSRQQFNFLKIQEEYRSGSQNYNGPEMMSSLKLIGSNVASPVMEMADPKVLDDMSKSFSGSSYPQSQPREYNIASVAHPSSNPKKVIIAHMANTPGVVRWALNHGANGVEMDLRFNGNQPSEFKHSVGLQPCDCTCACAVGSFCPQDSICNALWRETGSHCTASSSAEDMTKALGDEDVRSRLALIYIDSKLSNSMVDFFGAGYNLVKLLNRNTFDRGYQGQVVISGSEVIYTDYLKGALKAAKESKYADKYFYTFDDEGQNYGKVWDELLQLRTQNIAYATGITICLPTLYYDAIKGSLDKNAYAAVGIWTLDKPESIQSYLSIGTDAIMTNKPSAARLAINKDNLATPGNALVPKHVPDPPPVFWQCDCNYHKGGCTISKISPRNTACKCIYRTLLWTCRGETVNCSDANAALCKEPDASYAACKFGGGDCGGY